MNDYPAKKKKLTEKPKLCIKCLVERVAPPAKLCPSCVAVVDNSLIRSAKDYPELMKALNEKS